MTDSLLSFKTFLPKVLPIFKANSRKHIVINKLMTRDKIKRLNDPDKKYIYVNFVIVACVLKKFRRDFQINL